MVVCYFSADGTRRRQRRQGRDPWYIWCALLASATVQIGAHWDIAWHRSIGRDTFWSRPHLAIYLAAVLAALASGSQILATTFAGRGQRRERAVSVLGFRGPLGAFITAWGGIAMLTSAPFDDWWHNAYGLDVKILSPPHIVLAIGIFAINAGALIFVLGRGNGADERSRRRLAALSFYAGGIIIVALLTLFMEYTARIFMHGAAFYAIIAAVVPAILAAISRTTGHRRAATITAAVYSLFLLALLWIMPLVAAEPKLGPVTVRVPLDAAYIQHRFLPRATTVAALVRGAAQVLAMAVASSWIGLAWGDWMRRLQR